MQKMALNVRPMPLPNNSQRTEAYLAIVVGGEKISPMLDVVKWSYTGEVDLCTFTIHAPLLTSLLDTLL